MDIDPLTCSVSAMFVLFADVATSPTSGATRDLWYERRQTVLNNCFSFLNAQGEKKKMDLHSNILDVIALSRAKFLHFHAVLGKNCPNKYLIG